jgi:hypothetical protein
MRDPVVRFHGVFALVGLVLAAFGLSRGGFGSQDWTAWGPLLVGGPIAVGNLAVIIQALLRRRAGEQAVARPARISTLKARLYLALTLLGAAVFAVSIFGRKAIDNLDLTIALFAGGLLTTAVSLAFLVRELWRTHSRSRLMSGREVLARWHVDAPSWAAFRAFDKAQPCEWESLEHLPDTIPAQGTDVIVGARVVLIGDLYCLLHGEMNVLRAIDWLTPDPPAPECIEFRIVVHRHRMTPLHCSLRVPAPSTTRATALQAYAAFAARLRAQEPRRSEDA